MFLIATVSGIQDYLFDIHQVGGGQARALRARSFQIQAITEAITLRLLRATDLPAERVLLRAAAKVALDARGMDEAARTRLRATVTEIQHWLRDGTQGRLRLSVAEVDGETHPPWTTAQQALARSKLRPWRDLAIGASGWRPEELVVMSARDRDVQARRDEDVGRMLVHAESIEFLAELAQEAVATTGAPRGAEFDAAGLRVRLAARASPTSTALVGTLPAHRFALHVPTDADGRLVEFVELAGRAQGAPMLGVLKADVDGLGGAMTRSAEVDPSGEELRRLSSALNDFFGGEMQAAMRAGIAGGRWSDLYTVFAGGDDALLVGPWDAVLDFAGHLREVFAKRFESPHGLTISAGLALVKPRFPIRLGADQAEQLLRRAKSTAALGAAAPKDQFAAFDDVWKWEHHAAIVAAGKQLAGWVDAGHVQRSWLHTLLELTLLRRGRAGAQYTGVHPATATSRLIYHVTRNWPRPDDTNAERAAARAWIDAVAAEFDRYKQTAHVVTMYFPTVVRYAMLATRTQTTEDHE